LHGASVLAFEKLGACCAKGWPPLNCSNAKFLGEGHPPQLRLSTITNRFRVDPKETAKWSKLPNALLIKKGQSCSVRHKHGWPEMHVPGLWERAFFRR